jgi:N-acetylglucosaminyldiphosphoundecaprenol N-acetyl-beta-D-mannosaminyltransferase
MSAILMALEAAFEETLESTPKSMIGGLQVSAIDRRTAARIMIDAARKRPRGQRPLYFTSVNGEVIARAHADKSVAALFNSADQILADGQPLVIASRWLCRHRLPERVATTDLFHDAATLAVETGTTFYFLGATEFENLKAVAAIRARYPGLDISGHCHGYLTGERLAAKLDEINALGPDILWLGLGVPMEQTFVRTHGARLSNVGVIKTSGGLLNHLSGKNPRAPRWIQAAGFEWLWRGIIEPRRLAWRYLSTNPRAIYAILRYSQ